MTLPATAPGPRGDPLIGVIRGMRRSPIQLLMDATREHGDIVRLRLGPKIMHVLRAPNDIKHVLQDNNRNYGRQTVGYQKLKLVLGDGLVTSEGDFWRRQRRIAQPAFHRERIAKFASDMVRATDQMLIRWSDRRPDEQFDVAEEMMRLTLEIVATTIFSVDISEVAGGVGRDVTIVLRHITDRMTSVLFMFDDFPTPGNKRFREAIARLDEFTYRSIAMRRSSGEDPGDLLSMLMQALDDETGERMSDTQLRDELITMFGAGHETTANALTWTFYLLSKHPQIERRLFDELSSVLEGRLPQLRDLERLPFTRNVIKESMRLYPPVWAIGRNAYEDDVIGGYHIPKGSFVLSSPFVTHRHLELWDNPEGFDPDRWDTPRVRELPRFAYFPFGGGPHQCIGNAFAVMEAELIVATVMSRFRLVLSPGHPVELEPMITLRPRHGMQMIARKRA